MKQPSQRNFHLRIRIVRSTGSYSPAETALLMLPCTLTWYFVSLILRKALFLKWHVRKAHTLPRKSQAAGEAPFLPHSRGHSDHNHDFRQTSQSLAYHVTTTWNCPGKYARQLLCYLQLHKRFPQESVRQSKAKEFLGCYIAISNCRLP